MNKVLLNVVAGVFALFAGITSVQAQTYYLDHYQSGNESKTITFSQPDILLVGGLLNVHNNGAGVNGSICGIEIETYSTVYDENFQASVALSVSNVNLFIDSITGREAVPLTFTLAPSGNSFQARVTLRNLPISGLTRLQVRGNVNTVGIGARYGYLSARFTNLTPCTNTTSVNIDQLLLPARITVIPQKIDLEFVAKSSLLRVRQSSDSLGMITIRSLGVRTLSLCPKISGAGIQPYNMRLVTERGLQFVADHNGCFNPSINPEKPTTSWMLVTNTSVLDNKIGPDSITVDFVGFPETSYQIVGGNIGYRAEYANDLPKPIVLTYE